MSSAGSPSLAPPPGFAEQLRDALRESPYLAISVALHAVLIVLLATAAPPPPADPARVLTARPEALPEPPPPIVPPPETVLEPPPTETRLEPSLVDVPDPTPADVPSLVDASPTPSDAVSSVFSTLGFGDGFDGAGGPPGGYSRRGGELPAAYSAVVSAALTWLSAHQSEAGHWSAAAFDVECGKLGDDAVCDGLGNPQHDVGVTSLAVLAFLGAGHHHRQPGAWAGQVRQALRWLVDQQAPDGDFGDERLLQSTYDHAIATLAIVEAYAMSRDSLLREPATRALARLSTLRAPGGGWRYRAGHPEQAAHAQDLSVTGWALLALAAAETAGLPVDERAWADGLLLVEELTDPDTGRAGYVERGAGPARLPGTAGHWPADDSESMTAVAVLSRLFGGTRVTEPAAAERLERGAARLAALPPAWDEALPGRRDYYYWYYGAYALHERGGRAWPAWEKSLIAAVTTGQHAQGELRGSWDPQLDPWGSQGGRVYATALLALTMELPLRYAR